MLVSLVLVWRRLVFLERPVLPMFLSLASQVMLVLPKFVKLLPTSRVEGTDGTECAAVRLGLQGLQQTGCHLELSQDSTGTEPRTESPMLRKKPGFPMFKNTTPNRTLAFRVFWFRV